MSQTEFQRITERLIERSRESRAAYLRKINAQREQRRARQKLAAANLAHGYAALPTNDKFKVRVEPVPMLAIVSAYNEVLSAHQPLEHYPAIIKDEARRHAAVAQFAGGVPAMCDGVTQGQPGMELSLFSRDVIALSTAVALSHDLYDGVLLLGVCDKIVPGLLLGALSFGHLPTVFVPAGPMPTGISNSAKNQVRKEYAKGLVGPEALLESEMAAYHGPGTCTFYGTANSNQLLLEAMGLMVPGAAFVQPQEPEREQLTRQATAAVCELAHGRGGVEKLGIGDIVDERVIINAIVALLATGGSTNHSIHWVAIARAAGVALTWEDIDALSKIVPSLTRIYPNGEADVNQFAQTGGIAAVLNTLAEHGLFHTDVNSIVGTGNAAYRRFDWQQNQPDPSIIRQVTEPFAAEGGLRLLCGNIGKAVMKTSAVAVEHRLVSGPAKVFSSQEAVLGAFKEGALDQDCVVVVPGQGPKACGMPELHQLTPCLSVLLDRGYKVALLTDGRMSGASGRVPAAIHCSPEAMDGGLIGLIADGDLVTVDTQQGRLEVDISEAELAFRRRNLHTFGISGTSHGRDLFANFRQWVSRADQGASIFS